MALDVEHIVDGGSGLRESAVPTRGLEALHPSFALSQRLMGILCPVILPATRVVSPRKPKFAQCRAVGSKLVGHDGGWSDALLLGRVCASA